MIDGGEGVLRRISVLLVVFWGRSMLEAIARDTPGVRLTGGQADRHADPQIDRQVVRNTDKAVPGVYEKGKTDRQADPQTGRQADRQAGRSTDRQAG